jgi:hypothetical protein
MIQADKNTVRLPRYCQRIFLVVGILLPLLLASCREEDEDLEVFFPEEEARNTEIDSWIDENYTTPYNIAVEYRGIPTSCRPTKHWCRSGKIRLYPSWT